MSTPCSFARRKAQLLQRQEVEYDAFCKENDLKKLSDRLQVARYGPKQDRAAEKTAKSVEKKANSLYNLGSTEKNVKAYLSRAKTHDEMEAHDIRFKTWANEKEAVIDAGRPKITGERFHAIENREIKADRADMTVERAQSFVDDAKVTIYQTDRKSLKFLADEGYAILNLNHELVTAVPQKWRKKYDRFLEDIDETSR